MDHRLLVSMKYERGIGISRSEGVLRPQDWLIVCERIRYPQY